MRDNSFSRVLEVAAKDSMMSLPSEYVIKEAVSSIDDIIVYRANHPIHGKVNVYLPDNALPQELAKTVKARLYRNGLQMRNLSVLDVPLATKALEVSQNPNEPYIVTKYAKHDLDELINNGVTIKPKRMFAILSQVLQAIVNLAGKGWVVGRIRPRQVKLSELHTGDISFNFIEGKQLQIDLTGARVRLTSGGMADDESNKTATFIGEDPYLEITREQHRTAQSNIYILGSMTYQLLFGRQYQPSDALVAANIRRLKRRWRRILGKALSENTDSRYDTYEAILLDMGRAANRNRRVAVASIPFFLVLVVIAGYFGREQYRRYKITTSEAGQAIESFLDVISKTDDTFPELEKPEPVTPQPDEQSILRPFDEIKPIAED